METAGWTGHLRSQAGRKESERTAAEPVPTLPDLQRPWACGGGATLVHTRLQKEVEALLIWLF